MYWKIQENNTGKVRAKVKEIYLKKWDYEKVRLYKPGKLFRMLEQHLSNMSEALCNRSLNPKRNPWNRCLEWTQRKGIYLLTFFFNEINHIKILNSLVAAETELKKTDKANQYMTQMFCAKNRKYVHTGLSNITCEVKCLWVLTYP